MADRSERESLPQHSSDAFLNNLIDYAGLFPPAELPLDSAIRNYVSYVNDVDYWMIGPFVIPAVDLNKLDSYINLFTIDKPLSISALARKGQNEEESITFLKKDLATIVAFREIHGEKVNINFLELPLPGLNLRIEYLEKISRLMSEYDLFCYCEFPISSHDVSWERNFSDTLAKMAKVNVGSSDLLGGKLRTGGIRADLIPPLDIVASFIHRCKEYKIPVKFTAGLHHPLRMYRDEVQTEMHGFLNVFTAGLMAYAFNLDNSSILEIMKDQQPKNFTFKKDKLTWNDLDVTTEEIMELREKYLCSYGSCSFDEPREELKALNIIERG